MKDEAALKTFAHEAAVEIYTGSLVADDWINQLKVYYNIELKSETVALLWLYFLSLYHELLLERINDMVTPTQKAFIGDEAINKLIDFFNLLDSDSGGWNTAADVINAIRGYTKPRQEQQHQTLVQAYSESLSVALKEAVPSELIQHYIQHMVKKFEEYNFRQKLFTLTDHGLFGTNDVLADHQQL